MITIKQISSKETIQVRQPVLRPGKPVDACIFEGDDMPTTVHLGLYENTSLAGIVSIFQKSSELFTEEKQYQLRGMAVLDMYKMKGYGAALVLAAEKEVQQKNAELIWFNARVAATGFYKKMGYDIIGNSFLIGDIGSHYTMFKKLR